MKVYSSLLFCIFAIYISSGCTSTGCKTSEQCPTWHYPDPVVGTCKCGNQLQGVIKCEPKKRIRLFLWVCMTNDNLGNVTVTGSCPYSGQRNMSNELYRQQPMNVTKLDNFTCGRLRRRGLLCSHCEDSLGVAVLSYSYECTKCLGNFHGWLLYFTFTLVPATLFFLVVVFCKIHATAAHMNAVICINQMIFYDVNSQSLSYDIFNKMNKVLQTITGIWNLDFLHSVFPPFCINVHYSTLQVLAFEYIVAFYPLLLTIVTYICIELYDNNCRVIAFVWKPFSWCLSKIQKHRVLNLNSIKYNIISTFSSFIVFSYSKILFTCFNIMNFTHIYKVNGHNYMSQHQYFLRYNASIPYFSSQHKPYFITAVSIFAIFNVFPMLLLLVYPTKTFQKTLGCFPKVNWHFLHVFMDSFQGCYKNGTDNKWDYRYFAGLYLLIRIFNCLHNILDIKYIQEVYFLLFLCPWVFSVLFGVLRPYKNDLFNHLDCTFFGLLALSQFWIASDAWIVEVPLNVLYVCYFILVTYTLLLLAYYTLLLIMPQKLASLTRNLNTLLLSFK